MTAAPRDVEQFYSTSEVVAKLRRLADALETDKPFRIDLTAPSGDLWSWGPEGAAQTVAGSAYDFCLLVTQRINRADTSLVATGRDANLWLGIAQAFAGPPGEGREARDG